jgi:hypothetical protein
MPEPVSPCPDRTPSGCFLAQQLVDSVHETARHGELPEVTATVGHDSHLLRGNKCTLTHDRTPRTIGTGGSASTRTEPA